jgi:hypothetical protein
MRDRAPLQFALPVNVWYLLRVRTVPDVSAHIDVPPGVN